jgi:hemolysin III
MAKKNNDIEERETLTNTRSKIRQEIVNSMIHVFGILFGIVCIPILTSLAAKNANVSAIVGTSIYGFTFLMLFTFSAMYHGFQQPQVKRVLEILDHISIYFLIAGTYTPFILIYQRNYFGYMLLIILWSLTLLGIFFKLFFTGKFEILSVIIYMAMGWILLTGGKRFFSAMPEDVITFIIIGGAVYSIGIIFYLWKRLKWHHAIWHFLVLMAAISHYVAILFSVSR